MSVIDDDLPDADVAKARIRHRAERIRDRERRRALCRLRERTDLTEREAEVVGNLAASLTETLLSVPESGLTAVAEGDADRRRAAVALELFDGA